MFEIAGLDVEIVRLQITELRRKRVEAIVGQRHRLRMLQFRENARLKEEVRLQHVRLAGAQAVASGRGTPRQERNVSALPSLGERIARPQTIGLAAQLRRYARREFVAARETTGVSMDEMDFGLADTTLSECVDAISKLTDRAQIVGMLKRAYNELPLVSSDEPARPAARHPRAPPQRYDSELALKAADETSPSRTQVSRAIYGGGSDFLI